MQFLLLLIVNIFMGAVLYLIISLKLEKSASEFREKKLRKEMDDIIKEFNATADRNITILENRISIMKRLLQNSGDAKFIDVSIDEGYNDVNSSINSEIGLQFQEEKEEKQPVQRGDIVLKGSENNGNRKNVVPKAVKDNSLFSKNILGQLREKVSTVMDRFTAANAVNDDTAAADDDDAVTTRKDYYAELNESLDPIIKENIRNDSIATDHSFENETVEISDIEIKNHEGESVPVSISKEISEDEILTIISNASDKYSAISELHEKGFTIETISRYSGIPVGEVKLVLNLHGTGM